jgi:hypothetical protein
MWALVSTPAIFFLLLPEPSVLARCCGAFLPFGLSVALTRRADARERRRYWQGAAILIAFIFGAWVRLYFLPSEGSWDTEYWKAWMMRATSHGVGRVYGEPASVPDGRFLAQVRGEDPIGEPASVDYPPLAMILWRGSWWAVRTAAPAMVSSEARNVAAKLPSIVGDVGAVILLLWLFRKRPACAAALAALYWALPLSWLSSAILGYQDGAYAPWAAAAVVAAGRGRAGLAGGCLTVACLIKLLGLVVAPVVLAAFVVRRLHWRGWSKALLLSLTVSGLVAFPFVLEGTLAPLVVHIVRAVVPGNLSSGYANLWWVVGHILAVMGPGASGWAEPVEFVKLGAVGFPARFAGTVLVALVAVAVLWRYIRSSHEVPATLAALSIFFAYSMLAVGVYENHPHLIFLLMAAGGLSARPLQLVGVLSSAAYVLNLLALSGIGRFYGPRYMALEPLVLLISEIRMGLGFDVTLILAAVNILAFVLLLATLMIGWNRLRPVPGGRGEEGSELKLMDPSGDV